jgi:hypothetical protein
MYKLILKCSLAGRWLATVPTVVPAGMPTVAAAAKEPTAPAAGPAGVPVAATTPTARSREAAAAT